MEVEIILSIVLASSTVLYTVINLFMLIESNKTRKQKISPHIIAYIASTEDHQVYVLKFKNIGEGLAKNVKIEMLRDYKSFNVDGALISNIGIVKNGLNYFPPSHELQFYIDTPMNINDNNPEGAISLIISYKSIYGKKYKENFELQFKQLFGQSYSTPPETYIGKISYYLNEINKSIKKIN